jgi:hypothetical protein
VQNQRDYHHPDTQKGATCNTTETGFIEGIHFKNEKRKSCVKNFAVMIYKSVALK